MTTPTVKLVCGALELNLNDQTEFGVYSDFTPPDIAYTVAFADGTSANVSGGAELANKAVANTPFSFRVNVLGSSDADIRKNMGRIRRFLSFAEDQNEPLYLEFNSNSNIPRPLWGQGFFIRYQIAYGTVEYDKGYMVGASLSTDIDAVLNLIIKGYPVGLRQRLASAKGGIIEDNYGASDNVSRGLIVPEATTNLFTNPVFGNATYSTNWTIGSNLTAAQNIDTKFTLPGCLNSMRVFARNTTNNTVTESQTLAASSHTITAYVMLPDLTAPSATQLQIYYNSAAQTTTYEAIGNNGLYRCYATVTGTGGALATGVIIKNKYTVFLLGMQVEALAYPTPLCYGDLLGHSWNGTAHNSTSTRALGQLRLPIADDTIFRHQGSISVTARFPVSNTHPNNMYLFLIDTVSFSLYYSAASDQFNFFDGVNSATSSAKTFSPGQIYTFHVVWGPSGITLYINGVADGTNATFSPFATGSYLYLSYTTTPTLSTLTDFRVFDRPLTATEVANDYANVAQLTADNQRVGCIPYLWTKDGDDIVDNCDDSTHDNWAVCGGVPGSAEAITRWQMTESNTADLILSNLFTSYGNFARPAALDGNGIYYDAGGTAGAGTDSNSNYKLTSVTTTYAVLLGSGGIFTSGNSFQRVMREFFNREFFVVCRLYDEGSNFTGLRLTTQYGSSSATTQYPTWPITTTNANRLYLSKYGIVFPKIDNRDILSFDFILTLSGVRSTGTANIRLDWAMAIPKPFFVATNPGITNILTIEGEFGVWSSSGINNPTSVIGEAVNLMPEKANMIISIMGSSSVDPVIAWTNTFTRVDITPRYQLL